LLPKTPKPLRIIVINFEMFGGGMDDIPPGVANMGNAGLGPEQAEGISDAKTEEETGWDSDALLDEPIEN